MWLVPWVLKEGTPGLPPRSNDIAGLSWESNVVEEYSPVISNPLKSLLVEMLTENKDKQNKKFNYVHNSRRQECKIFPCYNQISINTENVLSFFFTNSPS